MMSEQTDAAALSAEAAQLAAAEKITSRHAQKVARQMGFDWGFVLKIGAIAAILLKQALGVLGGKPAVQTFTIHGQKAWMAEGLGDPPPGIV